MISEDDKVDGLIPDNMQIRIFPKDGAVVLQQWRWCYTRGEWRWNDVFTLGVDQAEALTE